MIQGEYSPIFPDLRRKVGRDGGWLAAAGGEHEQEHEQEYEDE